MRAARIAAEKIGLKKLEEQNRQTEEDIRRDLPEIEAERVATRDRHWPAGATLRNQYDDLDEVVVVVGQNDDGTYRTLRPNEGTYWLNFMCAPSNWIPIPRDQLLGNFMRIA